MRPVAATLLAARRGHFTQQVNFPLALGRISPTLISVGGQSPIFATEERISSVVTVSGSRPLSRSSAILVGHVILTPSSLANRSAIVLANLFALSRLSCPPISSIRAPVWPLLDFIPEIPMLSMGISFLALAITSLYFPSGAVTAMAAVVGGLLLLLLFAPPALGGVC